MFAVAIATLAACSKSTPPSPQGLADVERLDPPFEINPPPYAAVLEFNERQLAIPEEDRAWPALANAVLRAEATEGYKEFFDASYAMDFDASRAWIDRNHEIVIDLIEALQNEQLGLPYAWTLPPVLNSGEDYDVLLPGDTPPPLITLILADSRICRNAVHILCRFAADERTPPEDSISALIAARRMIEFDRINALIEWLAFQEFSSRIAIAATNRVAQPDMTEAQILRVCEAVSGLEALRPPTGERASIEDTLSLLYAGETEFSRTVAARLGAVFSFDILPPDEDQPNQPETPEEKADLAWLGLGLMKGQSARTGTKAHIATPEEELTSGRAFYDRLCHTLTLEPWTAIDDQVLRDMAIDINLTDDLDERFYPALNFFVLDTDDLDRYLHNYYAGNWSVVARFHTVAAAMRHRLRTGDLPESRESIEPALFTGESRHGLTGEPVPYERTETGFRVGQKWKLDAPWEWWDVEIPADDTPNTPEPRSP